jgi:Uma2 family endonuclease
MATDVAVQTQRGVEAEPIGDQQVTLRGVGWEGYARLLRMRGDRRVPLMIYLDGDVTLVSPCLPHEIFQQRLAQFIVELTVGLDIPCLHAGSTIYRRRKHEAGVEPDLSYYIANEGKVRRNTTIRLRKDPPPDLVIEVVHTHDADHATEVCRRLRVPELWIWEDDLVILALQPDVAYTEVQASLAFPFLGRAEVAAWINRPRGVSQTEWIKAVRAWVREDVVPRLAKRRPGPL